ncbi:MAG: hypothetical protein M1834_003109 [Cirrosporium novae-zelandiae]|nr:MAG: hypothetical protein M1834_003109 [Cirrosporium novae-zelandiae]
MANTAAASTSNGKPQPRQTRVNPTRISKTNARPLYYGRNFAMSAAPDPEPETTAPGFFPAITHFTDAISALPKEVIRHLSLLKEVDAKSYSSEEAIPGLINQIMNSSSHPHSSTSTLRSIDPSAVSTPDHFNSSNHSTTQDVNPISRLRLAVEKEPLEDLKPFKNLRDLMCNMMTTLDEKNHVLMTANSALNKHLVRLDEILPHVENEIAEEARLGSLAHWAYLDKLTAKGNGNSTGERTRNTGRAHHSPVGNNTTHDHEAVSRSETRREALARKRNHNGDPDFDNHGSHTKRTTGASKARKGIEATAVAASGQAGPATTNTTTAPAPVKRRRIEKPNAHTSNVEQSRNPPQNNVGNTSQAAGGNQAEVPIPEVAKKRGRGPNNPNASNKRRNGTNTSVAGSPLLASSPVIGTFSTTRGSPAAPQRPGSSRVRQNSIQSVLSEARQRPPSQASNKLLNPLGIMTSTADPNAIAGLVPNSLVDIKPATKDVSNPISEQIPAEEEVRPQTKVGGSVSTNKNGNKSMKNEPTDSNGDPMKGTETPPGVTARGVKTSKTSTPVNATFSDSARSRPARGTEPLPKRSHKKGQGLAAQRLAAVAADEEGSSLQGDDDDDDDESEPRYCYCNGVSYGEMVACDADNCRGEWFHLDCIGMTKPPKQNGKKSTFSVRL